MGNLAYYNRPLPEQATASKYEETPLFDGLGCERTVTDTAGVAQGTLTLTDFQ